MGCLQATTVHCGNSQAGPFLGDTQVADVGLGVPDGLAGPFSRCVQWTAAPGPLPALGSSLHCGLASSPPLISQGFSAIKPSQSLVQWNLKIRKHFKKVKYT